MAQNGVPDPFSLIAPGVLTTQTRAFFWENGVIRDLGTLGGPDAAGFAINARGQVAGASYTNSTPNASTGIPTEDPFQWTNGRMQDLGTLGGTLGSPNFMNDQGQVVGQSNLAGDSTFHPFQWSDGKLVDLGTLGGDNGAAMWINEAGDVVGYADLPGVQVQHGFLWSNGVLTDLGMPAGDQCSTALTINSMRQIVGESYDPCVNATTGHNWLWENGGPGVDLDTLILPGSGRLMYDAFDINDRGEIAGAAYSIETGDVHAVLLIPCDENHPGIEGCDYSLVVSPTAVEVHPAQAPQASATASTRARQSMAEMMAGRRSAMRNRYGRFGLRQQR